METTASHPSVGYVHLMYALHAFAGFLGVTSSASIVGAFLFGLPSIVAIIMNYARRESVRGTWLESHFLWQSRTFWSALILCVAIFFLSLILVFFGLLSLVSVVVTGTAGAVGAGAAFGTALVALVLGAMIAGVWILYRVIRGWLNLGKAKAMYA